MASIGRMAGRGFSPKGLPACQLRDQQVLVGKTTQAVNLMCAHQRGHCTYQPVSKLHGKDLNRRAEQFKGLVTIYRVNKLQF